MPTCRGQRTRACSWWSCRNRAGVCMYVCRLGVCEATSCWRSSGALGHLALQGEVAVSVVAVCTQLRCCHAGRAGTTPSVPGRRQCLSKSAWTHGMASNLSCVVCWHMLKHHVLRISSWLGQYGVRQVVGVSQLWACCCAMHGESSHCALSWRSNSSTNSHAEHVAGDIFVC